MSVSLDEQAARAANQADRPLRVCLVTEAGGGGVGRHFLDLAHGLADAGHDVTGIYSAKRLDAMFEKGLAQPTTAKFIPFAMRRSVHPGDAADLWRLLGVLKQHGPFDVIHGHSSKGGALGRLAARRLGVPSFYTSHAIVTLDPTLPGWKRQMYGRIERWLAKRTSALIAVSHDEAVHIHGLGIDPRKVQLVPNGIPQPEFPARAAIRAKLSLADDEVVIGFVGRLASQKAPEHLIEAFAQVVARQPRAKLVIVGSGPLEAEVHAAIARFQLGDRVLMLGDVVGLDVMPAFDIFCLSSRYEGMPYVYLEALAAGLPIVATNVGGATTCVEPGQNGLLVPPGDVTALAEALTMVVEQPALRERFAASSLEIAKRFTARQMVENTLRIYQQVLGSSVR